MINKLINLANYLDESGLNKEADQIDAIIKSADGGVDPDIDSSDYLDPSGFSEAGLLIHLPGLMELVALGILNNQQADKINKVGSEIINKIVKQAGPLADKYAKVQRIPRADVAADVKRNIKLAPNVMLILYVIALGSESIATSVLHHLGLLPTASGKSMAWVPKPEHSFVHLPSQLEKEGVLHLLIC